MFFQELSTFELISTVQHRQLFYTLKYSNFCNGNKILFHKIN